MSNKIFYLECDKCGARVERAVPMKYGKPPVCFACKRKARNEYQRIKGRRERMARKKAIHR